MIDVPLAVGEEFSSKWLFAPYLEQGLTNFAWLEVRSSPTEDLGFYDKDHFPVQAKLDGPVFHVPDTPGLGIGVNEDAIARQEAFKFSEAPHLYRRDGSYTNW